MTTATDTVPVIDRLAILERSLTKLKKKVRRLERTAEPPFEITPELARARFPVNRLRQFSGLLPSEQVLEPPDWLAHSSPQLPTQY